jgi:O-antigen/teichoic acid export membrane protein
VSPSAADGGAIRRLLGRKLVRAGIVTYSFSGLTLAANLVTGVVMARGLGPDGRGVAAALVTVTQLAGLLFASGVAQSLSLFLARRPEDGPSLLTTWACMLVPLAAIAIAVAQILLPTIFPNDAEAVHIGRWFMFTIVLVVGLELNYGALLGTHAYVLYNALRFAHPALTAVGFVVLLAADALTVDSALIAATASGVLVLAIGLGRSVGRIGLGPVVPRLGASALWYGVRGQGSTVANNVTARLDVAMLPAFVSASSVGLYSVATSVSLIVYQLSNTFAGLVIPATAREPRRGPLKVVASFWAALTIAGAAAIALALLARPLLGLVYGNEFRDAATSLLLLLPGAVLFAGSSILNAGTYAAGHPFTATSTQLLGMAMTVVGLFTFLDTGGVTAAAIVSSSSYATIFVASLVAYRTVARLSWRSLLPFPARLRALGQGPASAPGDGG